MVSLERFAALVMSDEIMQARLAAIADGADFIAQAIRTAQAHDIALAEASLLAAAQPDPLGLARWTQPPLTGSALPPRQWLPIGVAAAAGTAYVDWAWFDGMPLRGAFYEEALRGALGLPFNRVFRYRTRLQDLVAGASSADSVSIISEKRTPSFGQNDARSTIAKQACAAKPTQTCLEPDGFIFHMSRCGSTLVAQMLAALSDSIVISEAAPIDAVAQLARGMSEADGVRALRAIVAAFGRKRSGHERRYVLKLDCWHTLALPLFRRAFPDVPWVFLYRNPVEVLVSQMRRRGVQTVPQFLPPSFYGIAPAEAAPDEDYCARVLAAVCRAAIDHFDTGGGLILNYCRLPGAVFTRILPHFRMSCSEAEHESMARAARQDAKSPTVAFADDTAAKQGAATERIRAAADRHLVAIYNRLETLQERANSPPALR